MATNNSKSTRDKGFNFVGFFAILAIMLLFLGVSAKAGIRAYGAYLFAIPFIQPREEDGRRWRLPTGWTERLMALALCVIGFAVIIWPEAVLGLFGWDRK